ncbi:MAG: helix-turn-helix transcriptional regulator [Candidatus Hydrogenedentes bacterium]|nr:helix-turn-helix transcriptional regulator [Candidatus Hydrogenedentota bacterium]
MKLDKELVGASTSLLVLGVLANEPSYGYQIVKRVNAAADGIFEWQEGTIYPILHKLEKEKLVRAQWQEADTGRQRKYYYITASGRDALAAQTERWKEFNGIVAQLVEAPHG